jgi:hypothetical protein
MLHLFNQFHPLLSFTLEHETGRNINFLDLTLHRTSNGLKASIFRKPTTTDTIIHKWVVYSGTEVLYITRYFKKRNINITFRTSNTLGRYLTKAYRKSANSELLDKCGVNKLKCGSCSGVYLSQTGRKFKIKFKEHVNDIIDNREKSGYSTGHERAKYVNSLESNWNTIQRTVP